MGHGTSLTRAISGISEVPLLALLKVVLVTWMCGLTTLVKADALPWESAGTGDWGGKRASLAERGVTVLLTNDTVAQYNASGGIENGGAVANRLVGFLNWELGKTTSLKNSSIRVSAAWFTGDDINEKTGAIFKANTNYLDRQLRLYELYWEQYFADKQVNLHAGRVGFGPEEFGYTPILYEFLSAGFSSNPGAFFANQPVTVFSEAVATWGARALFTPKGRDYEVRLGVYNGWPRDQGRTDAHGLDWSLNLDESALLIGEFAYKLNQDAGDAGLEGNYKFGVMHDTGSFDQFSSPGRTTSGNTGYYFIFDQLVYAEQGPVILDENHPSNWSVGRRQTHPKNQGLYVWGSVVANPDDSINLFPYWVTGGLQYKGLFEDRGADRLGVGFRYGFTTPDLVLNDEYSLEAYYHYQINKWLSVAPDLQYIWNPGGGDNPNAFVVGFAVHRNL